MSGMEPSEIEAAMRQEQLHDNSVTWKQLFHRAQDNADAWKQIARGWKFGAYLMFVMFLASAALFVLYVLGVFR